MVSSDAVTIVGVDGVTSLELAQSGVGPLVFVAWQCNKWHHAKFYHATHRTS